MHLNMNVSSLLEATRLRRVMYNYMTRNKFQILKKILHSTDNMAASDGESLFKIRPLLEKLIANLQTAYKPGKLDSYFIMFSLSASGI